MEKNETQTGINIHDYIKNNHPQEKFDGKLYKALECFCIEANIDKKLAIGINYFIRSKEKKSHRVSDLEKIFTFTQKLNDISNGDLTKAEGMNYICDYSKLSLDNLLEKFLTNSEFWINKMGADFFHPYEKSKKRKEILRAPIGNTKFDLTCKGGSGDGSFSLDYAITLRDKSKYFNNTNGEMWRIGVDIDTMENGEKALRIIKTASGMKDEEKRKEYNKMRKIFHTSPHRILNFLMIYLANEMRFKTIKALSTHGAKTISSLSRSKTKFDYSASFTSCGFKEDEKSSAWLSINNLEENFYETIKNNLNTHEVSALDLIVKSFNNLKTQKGRSSPLELLKNNTKEQIKKELLTYAKLHKW